MKQEKITPTQQNAKGQYIMPERKPLNHTGTIQLETERLILRRTSISDAEQMYKNWASDPDVTKYLVWETHANIDVTREILTGWDEKYGNPDFYHWGIVEKESQQIIGTVGTHRLDEKHYSMELGYCMSRTYWGKGYMSEAVAAIIEYLFNTVGFNRISACHDTDNIGSGRVMQKCGMILEGTQRQVRYNIKRGGFIDLIWYAILKSDYDKNNVRG